MGSEVAASDRQCQKSFPEQVFNNCCRRRDLEVRQSKNNMANIELPSPPTDVVSSVRFSPDNSKLAVGSWDRNVYIYARSQDPAQPWSLNEKIEYDAPVLDVCWSPDSTSIFAVGLGQDVIQYNLQDELQNKVVLSTHDKASNKIAYSAQFDILISTGWGGTMHIHDPQSRRHVNVSLPAKPFALSLSSNRAVVAMAERKVWVYDLSALKMLVEQGGETAQTQQPMNVDPWQQRESSLKFMTRAIACMPDATGFATSSIEGRVGVEWFDPELEKDTYAFKCHRDKQTIATDEGEQEEVDVVYPVNALAFHPTYGTFATGGGEGSIVIWDPKTKRRLKQLPQLPSSVAAMDFSSDGSLLAVGISPGFEDGKETDEPVPDLIKVVVREISATEAKGKPAKEK
jgi:cell cycle arrest protein BUB3